MENRADLIPWLVGAGEGIRGNINSLVDNVGEQNEGRGGTGAVKPATATQGGERPAHVAARGADEIKQGMAELQKKPIFGVGRR